MASVRQVLASNHDSEPPSKKTKKDSLEPLQFIPLSNEEVEEEHTQEEPRTRPVWVKDHISLQHLSLREEVLHFFDWIKPTPAEELLRNYVITEISGVIMSLWKQAEVKVFGSHTTNIALPTSDIDLMVYNAGHPLGKEWHPEPLYELYHELKLNHKDKHSQIKLVSKARVPIIKMSSTLSTGEVKVDITISSNDGLPSSVAVAKFLQEMPVLRPLVLTLKHFLYQFNLHDTYTGGVGSFALALMAVSLLQLRKAAKMNDSKDFLHGLKDPKFITLFANSDDIGSLLASFFLLYGKLFNYKQCGISVRDNGYYFTKCERQWEQAASPQCLSIEDPTDDTNDVGRSSFNIHTVRGVFHNAFLRLTAKDGEIPDKFPSLINSTLLSRIIFVDPEILSMRTRAGTLVGSLIQQSSSDKKDKEKEKVPQSPNSPAKEKKRKWDF